jgi:hypothetical protein
MVLSSQDTREDTMLRLGELKDIGHRFLSVQRQPSTTRDREPYLPIYLVQQHVVRG